MCSHHLMQGRRRRGKRYISLSGVIVGSTLGVTEKETKYNVINRLHIMSGTTMCVIIHYYSYNIDVMDTVILHSLERKQVVILCDCIIVSHPLETHADVGYSVLISFSAWKVFDRIRDIIIFSLEKRKIRIYSWNNPKLALNGMSTRDILICCC